MSTADRYSGDLNLKFEGDRVVLVSAMVDGRDEGGKLMEFIWNPKVHDDPPRAYACSDLPGGHYRRCNEQ
jgi:hypothetical protein